MLESNTDRSYFMIGAVIIAAILIAGATFIFRDILFFADDAILPTMIDSIFTKADGMVNSMDTNTEIPEYSRPTPPTP